MKKLMIFLRMVVKVAPSYILLLVANSVLSSAKLFVNIILPKFLIEEIMGDCTQRMLFIWGCAIVLSNVLLTLLTGTVKKYLDTNVTVVYHRMNQVMADKIMKLPYSYLENPYYLDLKERAVFAINNQGATINLVRAAAEMLTGIITLTGLLAIMAVLGPVLIVVLAVALVLMLLLYKGMSSFQVMLMQELIPINRRYGYYLGLSYDKNVQKDCRLYDMSGMFKKRLAEFTDSSCNLFEKVGIRAGMSLGAMNAVNDLVAAFCYLYVGLRTLGTKLGSLYLGPQISIGSLTMYVAAAINFSTAMRELGVSVVNVMQILSYLEPYMEFMELPEEVAESGKELFTGDIETIAFEHVTFTYPGAEKPVLNDITFSIRKGEKISIVGLNGAGKSTLVKLLCRMYKTDSGMIRINGRDICDYEYESYMKTVSAVFQDYKLFNYTISENISCQDKDADREKVLHLIKEAGLAEKVESLPLGIDSRFGREYDKDGIEMSGGEGQKVAIARALYKEGSLVVLDEPASALDPIAEAEIYEKFNSLVEDKTAIYISHRMSSSVFCDRILIIDGGRVADFDTHENLMKKSDSLYYRLFNSQAENYRCEAV